MRSKVKQLALAIAADIRPAAKFRRVSDQFVNAVEVDVRAFITDRIRRHPSKGVTLK